MVRRRGVLVDGGGEGVLGDGGIKGHGGRGRICYCCLSGRVVGERDDWKIMGEQARGEE